MALNLADCVALTAKANPDKTAIVFGTHRMSFAELSAAVQRVANMLIAKGMKPGDRVAVLLPNTPQFPIIYYGILHAGGTAVTLNVLLKHREMYYQLNDCGAEILFVWNDFRKEALAAAQEIPGCKHIIEVEAGIVPETPELGESFMGLMMAADAECDMAQTSPDDTAVILYTSALEGLPRGAMLTHGNLYMSSIILMERVLRFDQNDICLCVLPLFHSFGQTTMMTIPLLAGGTVVMMPRFDGQKALEILQNEKVTIAAFVPTMLHLMVEAKKDHVYNLSAVRAIVSGGQALGADLHKRFEERFGISILEGYGLTETSPVVSFIRSVETYKAGSVGPPVWATKVEIRKEDGSVANTGEVGEIVVRGPNVMKGYFNQPEVTAKYMAGGWLHTGDLGYLDEDGFVFITRLKKDMIIRAGMNIYPRELETVICAYPCVAEAAVVGVPDTIRGEEVRAYIVLNPELPYDEKDLGMYCRDMLASYKCPRRFEVIEALPRTEDGVVDKESLRQRALQHS